MTSETFSNIASGIPSQPGIYKYYNDNNELIYVGKAKNLRKRVSSYFSKMQSSYKTAELVRRIDRIEFTIVNSEQDAFLLENSLIKAFQPLFNINLKDDKTYPYIVIKKEPFPRVFFTRRKMNDGSQYFGPYTSVANVRDMLEFIRRQIPLRTCKLNLTKKNIENNKFKVCLEYHLGNCKGPCEKHQSEDDYHHSIEQLKMILKGNLSPVMQEYKKQQQECIASLQFENAAVLQQKIDHLKRYQSKSSVVNINTGNVDVFTILEEGDTAYVNYLSVNEGNIVHTNTITLQKKLEESKEEVLAFAINSLRETFNSEATNIIVPFPVEIPNSKIEIIIPKGGDKKKLLDLSLKNVNYFQQVLKEKKILKLEEKDEDEKINVLLQLQDDLRLSELPQHIECFDNSNFHGSYPVAAMVCFKSGEPSKKDYRHFNIKTVSGINDFASMKEVVERRYKRLLEENLSLPQLVIIDGGKGQLNAALEAIELLQLSGKMTLVGLAKNKEELFFAGDKQSVLLPWNSDSLKLIRRIRDEVHRFGLSFHRNKRSKGTFKSELENLPGIGKKTTALLLQSFKSVKRIKEADEKSLAAVIGKTKAVSLYQLLHQKKKGTG